jgi:hypothetical protein
MEIQIEIDAGDKPLREVKDSLEAQGVLNESDVKLEMRTPKIKYRGIDPTMLVAIVGAAGAGLGALITGLLQIGKEIAARKIVLEAGGQKLEVPASTSPEQLDHLLEKLSQMSEVKKISVE